MDLFLSQALNRFRRERTPGNLFEVWKAQKRAGQPVNLALAEEVSSDWKFFGQLISFSEEYETEFSIQDVILTDPKLIKNIYQSAIGAIQENLDSFPIPSEIQDYVISGWQVDLMRQDAGFTHYYGESYFSVEKWFRAVQDETWLELHGFCQLNFDFGRYPNLVSLHRLRIKIRYEIKESKLVILESSILENQSVIYDRPNLPHWESSIAQFQTFNSSGYFELPKFWKKDSWKDRDQRIATTLSLSQIASGWPLKLVEKASSLENLQDLLRQELKKRRKLEIKEALNLWLKDVESRTEKKMPPPNSNSVL